MPEDEEKEKLEKLREDLNEVWQKYAGYPGLRKPLYFKLDPNKRVVPCGISEFNEQVEHPESRKVGRDKIGPYVVSTVFLMLDHGFGGPPLFFETMIFSEKTKKRRFFEYQWRYETYAAALEGHLAIVHLVKEGLLP